MWDHQQFVQLNASASWRMPFIYFLFCPLHKLHQKLQLKHLKYNLHCILLQHIKRCFTSLKSFKSYEHWSSISFHIWIEIQKAMPLIIFFPKRIKSNNMGIPNWETKKEEAEKGRSKNTWLLWWMHCSMLSWVDKRGETWVGPWWATFMAGKWAKPHWALQ